MKKLRNYYFLRSGEKYVVRKQRVVSTLIFLCTCFAAVSWHFKEKPDSTSVEVKVKTIDRDGTVTITTKRKVYGSGEESKAESSSKKSKSTKKKHVLKLKARQVLINESPTIGGLPTGSSAVGELLNTIDSRDSSQIVRVKLLYGLKSKSSMVFKKDSILLGKATYSQGNDRAYVSFFSVIHPNGIEEQVEAQALDSKDFSTGLIGKVHSDKAINTVGSIALNVISAAAGIATQKSMSVGNTNVPDFNAEDAVIGGAGSVARDEANNASSKLKSAQDYIKVRAGRELIVMLTKQIRR